MIHTLAFGEVLWDIIEGTPYLGGACFNLTAHLSRMSADASIITSVGDDELGERVIEAIGVYGIHPDYVTHNHERPTGTVDVFVDAAGQPDYTIHTETAWDYLSVSDEAMAGLTEASWDVFCFGTVAQRTSQNRELLNRLYEIVDTKEVFYDINLRRDLYHYDWIINSFEHSTIVKLNDDEVRIISEMIFDSSVDSPEDEKAFVRRFFKRFDLHVVIVTKGGDGAMAYDGNDFFSSTCQDVDIVDTVGAGDSFSAGFLYTYLTGGTVQESVNFAAMVADFVVGRRGAVPEYSKEIAERLAKPRQ